jgi:hypothetical protein
VDTDYEEKRNKDSSSCPSGAFALKGDQKEACRHDNSVLPQRPLYRGGEWNRPPSPTTNQLCLGKNHLSGKLVDEGTDTITLGDIMKLEKEIRRSLCREMRFRRWEKLQMNESSGKGGILADVIISELKSRLSRR